MLLKSAEYTHSSVKPCPEADCAYRLPLLKGPGLRLLAEGVTSKPTVINDEKEQWSVALTMPGKLMSPLTGTVQCADVTV